VDAVDDAAPMESAVVDELSPLVSGPVSKHPAPNITASGASVTQTCLSFMRHS
jgi:hypothetical protein